MVDKVIKARAHMIQGQPFFGALALRLGLKPDPSVDVMATDGETLFYNPAWVEARPLEIITGVVAHEVTHCALNHHTRRGARDSELWNVAADHVVNGVLTQAGFALPVGALNDPRFTGKNVDEVYATLKGEQPPASQPQPEEQDEKSEEDQGDEESPSQGGSGDDEPNDSGEASQETQEGTPGDDDGADPSEGSGDGQGAPATAADDGRGKPSVGGCGRIMDSAASTPGEIAEQEQDWEIATVQAANAAQAAGNLPGCFRSMVEEIKRGTVDWREELRRFFQRAAKDDFRMIPPNRRFVARGLYLPSLRSETVSHVTVIVDTSGSTLSQLPAFAAELASIFEEIEPARVDVIYADTAVQRVDTWEAGDAPLTFDAPGGGGTMFSPAFAWIARQEEQPDACIYLTDLYASDFGEAPEFPVLWAATRPGFNQYTTPFGEVVPVREGA